MSDLRNTIHNELTGCGKEVLTSFLIEEFGDYNWCASSARNLHTKFIHQGITVKEDSHYGGEDQGEEYWTVYAFKRGDETLYVQFDGYYASYDGATFQRWFFVEPKQVMVTQFVEVKE